MDCDRRVCRRQLHPCRPSAAGALRDVLRGVICAHRLDRRTANLALRIPNPIPNPAASCAATARCSRWESFSRPSRRFR
jgi:hypothetical protein